MKIDIHPQSQEVTARCACGSSFVTRSTAQELRTTLCSQCHPFFTGTQKFVDTAGRIEKFAKKFQNVDIGASAKQSQAKADEKLAAAKAAAAKNVKPEIKVSVKPVVKPAHAKAPKATAAPAPKAKK
jgi:large subunit ribosomal protein L31